MTQVTAAIPPRTHDLLRLAALAGLSFSVQQREFLARLQQYCLEGRYPDLPLALPDGEEAAAQLDEAREIKAWLASQLT